MKKEKVLRSVNINDIGQKPSNNIDQFVEKLKHKTLDFSEIDKNRYTNKVFSHTSFGPSVDNIRWINKVKEYVNFYTRKGEWDKLQ